MPHKLPTFHLTQIIIYSLAICYSTMISGQVCEGNKGVNIFTKGDFGSGAAPVVLINPNIAPGYNYTSVIPGDGFYSIIKNTAVWMLYPTWLSITDNSTDPNGYMMVVNASFAPGIFYEETVEDICGNTLYEFSADVINMIKSGTPNHIDPVVDFLIDDVVRFSTGNIPKNEKWNTYGFTFVAPANATSVKLTLRNNAPGGIGNDLALDNISFRACGPSAFVDIDPSKILVLCIDDEPFEIKAQITGTNNPNIIWQISDDGYEWTDLPFNDATSIFHTNFDVGSYYYRYLSAGSSTSIQNEKCRVISDEVIINILPPEYFVKDSICSNQVYTFGSQQLTASGNYQSDFQSIRGCDSIVYLDLKVIEPSIIHDVYDDICLQGIEIYNVNFTGPYTVAIDASNTVNTPTFPIKIPLDVGVHDVTITSISGCSKSFSDEIIDNKIFVAAIDTLPLSTNIYQLGITSNTDVVSAIWTSSAYLSCTNCLDPIIKIDKDEEIIATLILAGNCERMVSITIKYMELPALQIANIFSPNGDGINDMFYVQYPDDNITIKAMSVYDRWGTLIYNTEKTFVNDPTIGWDGTYKNTPSDSGVYTYLFVLNDILGEELGTYSGSVTLIR